MAVLVKIPMHITRLLGILGLVTLCASNPVASNLRRAKTDNLDILVHDGNGALVRTPRTQRREVLQKRQKPGQVTSIGSGECKYAKVINDIKHPACSLFCDVQSIIVSGTPQKVSADVGCTTTTCSTAFAYSITITDSFSVNAGITASYAKSGITAQATLGYTHTWSTAIGTTNTYTFNPSKGDNGHIIFVPYMEEVCGSLTIFENSGEYYECLDWSKHKDGVNQNHVLQYDPMSCGQTPINLESGGADGIYSFCNIDTGVGCGA